MKKKIVSILMSALCLVGCAGCGAVMGGPTSEDPNAGDPNRTKTLAVSIFDGGYGTGWLYAIKREFESVYTDVYVSVTPSYSDANARTELQSGASPYHLYFMKDNYYTNVDIGTVRINKVSYDSYWADITDVYEGPAYGETSPIKLKFASEQLDWLKSSKGKYHGISWGNGLTGLICNKKILDANGWDVPVTTNEMLDLFEKIKNANLTNSNGQKTYPFTLCPTDDNCYRQMQETLFAQYNGTENWHNWWNGIDENGNEYQTSLITNKGILRSLEVCEDMLNDNNGYLHDTFISDDFVTNEFRIFNDEVVFISNGDWILNEVASGYTEEELSGMRIIKFPLISSIVEKLEDSDMSDETLQSIVRAIDADATSSDLCSDEDFAIIKDARSIALDISNIHLAVIPVYSKEIDLAKEFLRFVYSDKGIALYAKNTRGNVIPVKEYDYAAAGVTLNNFAQSAVDISNSSVRLNVYNAKHKLFTLNGFSMFLGEPLWTTKLFSLNASDRKTAQELYDSNIKYTVAGWDNYVQNLT